jgi:hypothetical protein
MSMGESMEGSVGCFLMLMGMVICLLPGICRKPSEKGLISGYNFGKFFFDQIRF